MKTQEQEKARNQRGQALAEFSLILPVLLLVVFGIIDFGRVLFVFADASGKLRDAARYAAVLGLEGNTNSPQYAECVDGSDADNEGIREVALSTMFVSNEVVEVYYWDTTDPGDSGLTPLDPDPALYPNHAAYLLTAHYSCFGTNGITDIDDVGPSVLESGDILRVHYTGRINFMTPFLSAIWSGIDLDFFAQRSIIDQLILGSDEGIDYDFDGLDDRWEFMWYGCREDAADTSPRWVVDDEWLYADLSTWREWTVHPAGGGPSQNWYTDDGIDNEVCGMREVTNPDDPNLDDVPIPQHINLDDTNAIRDFDNDGCSAGCEENRNSNPNDIDADGDGLNDGQEATIYFTNPTGGDFYYCDNNRRFETPDLDGNGIGDGDGVPDGYDSDCDGVPDGVEVGVFEPNDPSRHYEGAPLTELGYPYRPSYAFIVDSDVNGEFDSVDSDGDGLYEYTEYYDDTPCDDVRELPAGYTISPATPYDCHPDLEARYRPGGLTPISFPTNEYLTSSTYYDDTAPTGADGYDTDNDGLSDKEEIDGWDPGDFEINRVMEYNLWYSSHPNFADSDLNPALGDGEDETTDPANERETRDIDEKTIPANAAGGFTDPMNPDTDGDGLSDWEELNAEYPSNPLDDDSDYDGLSDGNELPASFPGNPNSDGTPMTGYDYDGDGLADVGYYVDSVGEIYGTDHPENFSSYSSDPAYASVTLPAEVLITADACKYMNDGYEVNFLNTDPGELDSDNDGLSDCYEVDNNLDPNNPDSDTDADGNAAPDGIPDGIDCDPHNPSSFTIVQGCNINDVDNDGMGDNWEFVNLGSTDASPVDDPDGDTCNNLCEFQRGTNPSGQHNNTCIVNVDDNTRIFIEGTPDNDTFADGYDTDCDGLHDGEELPDSSPTDYDTDDDGLIDGFEMNYSYNGVNPSPLNPRSGNTDGDDISDYDELFNSAFAGVCANGNGLNPAASDTDSDGLADHLEVNADAYVSRFPGNYPAQFRTLGTDPCDTNTDDDGWTDTQEIFTYTGANPRNKDTDGDGIQDDVENSVTATTYTIYDNRTCNGDGTYTNVADNIPDGRDTDCDGLRDGIEVYINHPDLLDSSGGLLDGFEMDIYLCDSFSETVLVSLLSPNNYDSDSDGLSDGQEWNPELNGGAGDGIGTSPQDANTDNDLWSDGVEYNGNPATDPLCGADTSGDPNDRDGDTLSNTAEQTGHILPNPWNTLWGQPKTNPDSRDSDGDFIEDQDEIAGRAFEYTYIDTAGNEQTVTYTTANPLITNPTHLDLDGDGDDDGWDSDDDGLSDLQEFNGAAVYDIDCDRDGNPESGITFPLLTDPAKYDTDGDGMPDGIEIDYGMNPLDATCGPAIIFAKVGSWMQTAILMYWRAPGSTTVNMTATEAEQAAYGYVDIFYVGNRTGSVYTNMTVGFVGGTRNCNAQQYASYNTLVGIISAAGGTNIPVAGENQLSGCMVRADVTFQQMIDIALDPFVREIIDHENAPAQH